MSQQSARIPPPQAALHAFGLAGEPSPLAGGRGLAWRVGEYVLKPVGETVPEELEWRAELFDRIEPRGVRIPRYRRAKDGGVVANGWSCEDWLEGRHEQRWADVLNAGERFHAALAREKRPAFLDERVDPWAIGDRIAWDEQPPDSFRQVPFIARLLKLRGPVEAPSQLIHGDLGGNVLFAGDLPPAVIDFSPYWRPTGLASAIVVADALAWEGADDSILDTVRDLAHFGQLLIRATIYRAVTQEIFEPGSVAEGMARAPFTRLAELAERLLR